MAIANTYKYILFERQDRVGVITFNRPEKLNAWTYEMNGEMLNAIEACNNDPGIGAIIITGAGRGFCAGADVRGFNNSIEAREANDGRRGSMDAPPESEHLAATLRRAKPLIAAVNGISMGVGMTLTLPMDLRIASENARFSMRFVRMGITPEVASTTYLPQIVGLPNALDMILTGRIVEAPEAERMGLVQQVVPADKLMDAALAVASEIAANPNDEVLQAKRLVHQHMVEQDIDAVVKEENRSITRAYTGPDHKEAVTAFLEKRQPQFNQ
ncbi:MAG: enoyl-CoA hydratase-related protein [Chloroflexota bacterium]